MRCLRRGSPRRSRASFVRKAGPAPYARQRALAFLFGVLASLSVASVGLAEEMTEIRIGYLHTAESRVRLSLVDVPADNNGIAGAELAIEDNNTTGRFVNQRYALIVKTLRADDDVAAAVGALADAGVVMIVADTDAAGVLKAAGAAKARGLAIINASATDDRLREEDCRANVVHVAPTRSMLADGLAQYLAWKKWRRWLLIVGSHENDKLFADALRRSAARFGAKIVEEREFKDTGGARRTDSGIVEIQRQMPVLTQSAPDYDVLVAADESEVFAGYLPYRTWDARPVAGSAGLVPTTWDAAFDQWGAIQLQSRFGRQFHRFMTPLDMQAWSAERLVGEAATRSNSADPAKLIAFIKSPDFALAAFKGQKLSLRDWNLQLRQPILLFDGRNTVSVSPQEGFLHQTSELDTLGIDRPETKCKLD
jgi:ABC transporter substrate binding protein (PQQ-dependent alcohol dehydrogenase system)